MKKYLLIIFILFLCSCSTTKIESSVAKTNSKLEVGNIQIGEITKIDDMQVFEISLKDSTIMFTSIDHKTKFISYHKEDVNTYITYLNDEDLLLGEFIENESNYCSYLFLDETANNCSKAQIEDLKQLNTNFTNDLEKINISMDELIEWADWYLQK